MHVIDDGSCESTIYHNDSTSIVQLRSNFVWARSTSPSPLQISTRSWTMHLGMYPASEILYHLNFLHSSHSVYLYIHVCIVYRELIISARKVMSYTHNHSWKNMPFQTTLHKSYLLCHYFSLFWFWLGHCWGLQTCVEGMHQESIFSMTTLSLMDWKWSNWSLPCNWQFRLGAVY